MTLKKYLKKKVMFRDIIWIEKCWDYVSKAAKVLTLF